MWELHDVIKNTEKLWSFILVIETEESSREVILIHAMQTIDN